MPIVIDYTPAGAVGGLASMAGRNIASERAAERAQQLALQSNAHRNSMEMAAFQAELQGLSQQQRMKYDMDLLNAKAAVTLQQQVSEYAQKQQKLTSLFREIDDAEYLSPKEKEDMRLRAMAKYADAWAGNEVAGPDDKNAALAAAAAFKLQQYNEIMASNRSSEEKAVLIRALNINNQMPGETKEKTKTADDYRKEQAALQTKLNDFNARLSSTYWQGNPSGPFKGQGLYKFKPGTKKPERKVNEQEMADYDTLVKSKTDTEYALKLNSALMHAAEGTITAEEHNFLYERALGYFNSLRSELTEQERKDIADTREIWSRDPMLLARLVEDLRKRAYGK